jgi:endoglucanase
MKLNVIRRTAIVAGLLTASLFPAAQAQGFLHAEGQKIVNEKGENVLLRGMGLGGWMLQEGYMLKINKEAQQYRIRERIAELTSEAQAREFYDRWLANHTRKADIDSLKAWGFNSVRLPMHYDLYTLPADKEPVAGKDTWLKKGFAMTDSLLAWCKANQVYLILDLHAAPGGQGNDLNIADRDPSKPSLWDSEANQQKTVALWKKLAERYKDEPWIGAYDLINEPNWGFENSTEDKNGLKEQKNAPLQKLLIAITEAVRTVDKKHMIIIEGNGWGNNYNGMTPDWDKNMALSFHKYWNYNDQASVAHILQMREKYNMPAWLGETGENSNVWFTDAIRLLEKNNIGWSWWPLKKLGFNNPSEIRSNPSYDAIADYMNGKGAKPAKENAYQGLMELAEATKIENTIIHRDVIDAMIRQPFTAATLPFKNHTLRKSLLVPAVDYDLGISGAAYFDKDSADYHVVTGKSTAGNKGRVYRNDGVDISRAATDQYDVSSIETGEWLQYTVNVAESGVYTVELATSPVETGGLVSLAVNGVKTGKALPIPVSGAPAVFKETVFKNIILGKGQQRIRVYAEKGGFNLRSLKFTLD